MATDKPESTTEWQVVKTLKFGRLVRQIFADDQTVRAVIKALVNQANFPPTDDGRNKARKIARKCRIALDQLPEDQRGVLTAIGNDAPTDFEIAGMLNTTSEEIQRIREEAKQAVYDKIVELMAEA